MSIEALSNPEQSQDMASSETTADIDPASQPADALLSEVGELATAASDVRDAPRRDATQRLMTFIIADLRRHNRAS